MLTPPERQLPKNVAGTTVPALLFQKVVVSHHEMRGPRIAFFVVGPPCGQQHLEGCLRAGGGQTSQNLFKNSLFEQTSVCCWPSIVVKIDPKRSFFTFGPPLPARNTSKVASGLLLGCSWAAPGCSWAAPGCSWAPPGSSWAPPHTHKYTHKPS